MIRKVKAKRKRRNPYLVEYGYHFTNSGNLESIMEKGLIPGIKTWWYEYQEGCRQKVADQIYKQKSPIYFSDIPNNRNLPDTLKQHFKNSNYDTCLKVDCSSLNQTPDIFMLIIDYGCDCTSVNRGDPAFWMKPLKYKGIKSLNKALDKYEDYIVPFHALKEDGDKDLQSELIFLTGTFVVNQKIPPKYIEEIIQIK